MNYRAPLLALALTGMAAISVADDALEIDASDPTKVYTYVGVGLKFTDYTNGETMLETRMVANWGIDANDMMLFEVGYGWHDGDRIAGSNESVTNLRVRYFHLFDMDYELERGYRGMGLQFDVQLAGSLKGTDGQNVISAGIMPAFALGGDWNLYVMASAMGAWDKNFERFSGAGVSIGPKVVFAPDWWAGSQFQLTPMYRYFLSGDLENEGSGNIEFNIGGEFNPVTTWDVVAEKNFDVDLRTLRRGVNTGLENDWSLFFNVSRYF